MTTDKEIKLGNLPDSALSADSPVLLFDNRQGHSVYWLGIAGETAFRCNTYLVVDGEEGLLIDPGARYAFDEIRTRVEQVLPPERLTGLVLSHQDPDVAASMHRWLALKSDLAILATPRTHVLLPHYCHGEYVRYNVEENSCFSFSSGNRMKFVPAPFLHFPGAVTTFDPVSEYLFSGDVWAAFDTDSKLLVADFSQHKDRLDLFHKDYMASNLAARGFVRSVAGYGIKGILPQHGSIIPECFVPDAMNYLKELQCGLDLIYPADVQDLLSSDSPVPDADMCGGKAGEGAGGAAERHAEGLNAGGRIGLEEALAQAARLARLREDALRQLNSAEICLKQNSERLAEAQRIARLGYWEWELDKNKITWSDEIYSIFGISPEDFEATYDAFLDMVHPDDVAKVKEAITNAVEEYVPYDLIHRIVRPDGEVRTVHERGRVHTDDDGNVIRMLGTVQDITEIASIEADLARKNRLIEAIQQMQSDFISELDILPLNRNLLSNLLELSGNEQGFTGSVLRNPEGKPYLAIHALTDMSWDPESRELFRIARRKGLEFHNLDNLFGAAVTSGKPVISNDPGTDPRSGGTPKGHPRIRNFLAVPVYFGDKIVGLIGLANRPGGFGEDIIEYLEPLLSAFGQILQAKRDQDARRAAEKILIQQARLDGLLGIPNRRYLDEQLERQLRQARRSGTPFSVIMIDVDHFKAYNDFYGHQAGDRCLREVTGIIRKNLRRPMDFLGRYGGEELCCILPETDCKGAVEVASNIRSGLARAAIPHEKSPVSSFVTVSMGVATWLPESGMSAEELLGKADRNMYRAKKKGRNCVVTDCS